MNDPKAEIEYGPAMRALSPMRQKFVLAMLANPFGSRRQWAIDAGYSNVKDGAKVRAHEVWQDPLIQPAALEVSRAMLGALGPVLATAGLLKVAANPKHPQYVKALELVANRVGLQEKQEIEVTHRDLTGDALLHRLHALAGRLGLDAQRLLGENISDVSRETVGEPKVIEHKASDE